jgi:hypothetical protein
MGEKWHALKKHIHFMIFEMNHTWSAAKLQVKLWTCKLQVPGNLSAFKIYAIELFKMYAKTAGNMS